MEEKYIIRVENGYIYYAYWGAGSVAINSSGSNIGKIQPGSV